MAYVNMTRTELFAAPQMLKDMFISLRNFNQFDATSKVMYQHEIICTGNTGQFN